MLLNFVHTTYVSVKNNLQDADMDGLFDIFVRRLFKSSNSISKTAGFILTLLKMLWICLMHFIKTSSENPVVVMILIKTSHPKHSYRKFA